MDVTLWYGQLDHISDVTSDGLNIQDSSNALVYAIADSIVAAVQDDKVYVDLNTKVKSCRAL